MVTSRIWFTAAQKAELWERWKNGQSAAAISRALERKNKTGVERIVVLHGGIGPAPRRRALAALRFEEREEISRGIAVGRSIRQIAQGLGRAPSTVSREIRRNGGSQAYRANRADRRARERALRPKPCRLALYSALRWRVAQKLALQWSPQQISGWLKQEFPTHQDMQISHEAIYRSLFIQTRGVLKKELSAQLRTARRMRHPKSHNAKSGQGHILDMVYIRERPAEIEDRAVPGHREGPIARVVDAHGEASRAAAARARSVVPEGRQPARADRERSRRAHRVDPPVRAREDLSRRNGWPRRIRLPLLRARGVERRVRQRDVGAPPDACSQRSYVGRSQPGREQHPVVAALELLLPAASERARSAPAAPPPSASGSAAPRPARGRRTRARRKRSTGR